MDCSLPGSSVHGNLQARTLEWVALISRDSSDSGVEPGSPALLADSLASESPGRPLEPILCNKDPAQWGGKRKVRSFKCKQAKPLQSNCLQPYVAPQAPLSMEFSRQEYWSGLPCPPPGDLPEPGNKPKSLLSPALAGGFFITSATWEALAASSAQANHLIFCNIINYVSFTLIRATLI